MFGGGGGGGAARGVCGVLETVLAYIENSPSKAPFFAYIFQTILDEVPLVLHNNSVEKFNLSYVLSFKIIIFFNKTFLPSDLNERRANCFSIRWTVLIRSIGYKSG